MKQVKSTWRNRIVGYSEEEPDKLLANPSNWRIHPAAQQNALSGVLKEVGLVQNVVANRTTGHLVDGHLRVMLAMRENQPVVPVTWVELSEEEEHLILASLDPLAAMATADAGALDALLSSVQSGEAAVQAMLAELAEGAGLYQPKDTEDAEPQVDRAEELRQEWGVEPGQLWRLPSRTPGQEHRLICGDCTDAAVVERAMGGERAGAVVTDPPYGQEQVGVPHDSPEEHAALMRGCIAVLPVDNGVVIAFQSPRTFPDWLGAIGQGNHKFRRALWLYKEAQETYPWRGWIMKSEMILVSEVGVGEWVEVKPYAHDCYKVSEVSYRTEKIAAVRTHGSVKPLTVIQDLISRVGGIVYDPFVGSGTTLIAAENLSRQCRAVEISPGYVAVALQRYLDAFGIRGELAG